MSSSTTVRRLVLAGLGLALVFATAVGGDQPLSNAEIDRLIKMLGSDRAADRDDATERLEQAGTQTYLPLRRAAVSHSNSEVRKRAGELVTTMAERYFGEERLIEGHAGQVNGIAVGGDGRQLVSGGLDGTLRLWDVESGQQMKGWENHPGAVWAMAISRDGSLAASVPGMTLKGKQWVRGTDFGIRLWDVESGKELRRLVGHKDEVRCLTLSPDQKRMLSASWDGTARLWDIATGNEVRKLEGHKDRVRWAAFAPDGKRAVTTGKDGTARVWDLESGKELTRFEGHAEDVMTAEFTPDGKRVVSAGADKMVRLWDAQTGKEVRRFSGHKSVVWTVAVSKDGRWVLSGAGHKGDGDGYYSAAGGDFEVRLWDLANGEEIQAFKGHGSAVLGVRFVGDGRQAVSCGNDATIRLWKVFADAP